MPIYNVKPQLNNGGGEGSGVFTVTLTKGENAWLEQDKTNEEILEALSKGVVAVVYNLGGNMYNNALILRGFADMSGYGFNLLTITEGGAYVQFRDNHFYEAGTSPD